MPLPRVVLAPSEQQRGGQRDEDQIGAPAGMDRDVAVGVAVVAARYSETLAGRSTEKGCRPDTGRRSWSG